MSHVSDFAAVLAEQPADWALIEVFVALDDPLRLNEARVALARANARPLRAEGNHDFSITVANQHGRGAAAGVVTSALSLLDRLEITGRTWGGESYALFRPAPPHRFGP